jgi:hypothetical protein
MSTTHWNLPPPTRRPRNLSQWKLNYRVVKSLTVKRLDPKLAIQEMQIPSGIIIGVHSSNDHESFSLISYNGEIFACDRKTLFLSITPA